MMNHTNEAQRKQVEIFPVPQEMNMLEGEARLTDRIHIVAQAGLKVATLPTLQDMLSKQGYTYTVSDTFESDVTNVYLTTETQLNESILRSHIDTATIKALSHKEGYHLIIQGISSISHIAIIGQDADGIHYGVVTLNQILKQSSDHQVPRCMITDYPEILYRGYIEGFYGYPWSHADRIDLMQFGGEQKLNTYIYAPKDDPYHRKSWRDLYPADKAQEIAGLAAAGHRNNLNFVWTIHPGDSIDLASEEDFQSCIVKLEQLYSLGVRQFGVLFDDLVGVPNGPQQAAFINRIDTEFVKAKGDIRPLLTVGTRYCEAWGPSMTEYMKPFVETLHDDVEIMWTGAATMSNISREQYESPKRTMGTNKNLSVWWNYPVNDYCDNKILMGKIENISSDLNNVNGFFSNPMNQAQASKQALFCIADHNWNTDAFNTNRSFSASFQALAPEVAEDLEIFASNSCYLLDDGGVSGDFLFDESWMLKDDVRAVKEGVASGADVRDAANRLLAQFERMESSVDNIRAKCQNANLVQELEPFLEAFQRMARAAQHVIHGVHAKQAGDLLAMEQHHEDASRLLASMEACKVNRLKEGVPTDFTVDVGTHVIKPFITDIVVITAVAAGTEQQTVAPKYDMNNIALRSLGVTATASSSTNENEGPDKVIKGTIAGGKWCSMEHRPHLTIDLQEPKTIKQYRIINCGHPEARETAFWNTRQAQILACQDGENFTLIDEILDNKGHTINRILLNEVTARYIRLQIIEPAQISIDGSGHTRIYAFELFDERYPELSDKVSTSDIHVDATGRITINHVNEGDVITLYSSMDADRPLAVSEEAAKDAQSIVFDAVDLSNLGGRVFVQRTTRNHLPSVRTSKGFSMN
ncbi:beta-N-acetylglucosaminidase domain-containing protein [Paenibacillus sp. LHD-38]|uniref:beta-N-acetylglucosaminidase domain-containing protein n=1 Tax=Paenibacillus sp. LHD-38 TaxID=3072143 RepID=UPI00280FFA72|nr:beta-N-acetylglucosaminidase domain-containing protein [Paenibacillus sp. LHD-38]MDQ8738996.1 beta-N-acetylglucosaminidase domain-containing protein [Paenibacillus sp. LHD-38]